MDPANLLTKRHWIAELARRKPGAVLYSLNHVIDFEWMREAYLQTRKDGATGIDGVTAADYEANLEANLRDLLERIKSGRYHAPPVRRTYIPKADGSQRPLGIPTFEDKIAQRAVAMVLEAIYEQDFLPCSYGFRPGRSAHQALRELYGVTTRQGQYWVIEVDIRKYFDSIPHSHLRAILDQRVTDGVIRRMIDKWLKAGVLEDGLLRLATEGTPQGGVISPILSNIFLHHVLDEWFEKEVRPRMTGPCTLVRFADDFVMTFKNHHDAKRVMQAGHGGVGQAAWTVWAHAPSRQDALHRLPPRASRWHASGLRRAAVRLSRLHPHLDEVAEGQERGAPANGQKPARPRAGCDQRLVSEQPPPAAGGPAATADRQAGRPLRLLRHHREHRATRPVLPSDRTAMAEMAGPTNAPACPVMGQVQRDPRTLSTPQASGHPSLRRAQRSSPVKNRKREICTSGTVGGEGGNILTYPASLPQRDAAGSWQWQVGARRKWRMGSSTIRH